MKFKKHIYLKKSFLIYLNLSSSYLYVFSNWKQYFLVSDLSEKNFFKIRKKIIL